MKILSLTDEGFRQKSSALTASLKDSHSLFSLTCGTDLRLANERIRKGNSPQHILAKAGPLEEKQLSFRLQSGFERM